MLLDSQRRRRESAQSVAARMLCTPQAWRQFRHHAEDPQWLERLTRAKVNPGGDDARSVRRIALGFLQLCGKQVKWSAAERASCKSDLYALSRRFGVASVFWTVAFDDVNDGKVIRLSLISTSNKSFPAKANALRSHLYNGKPAELKDEGGAVLLTLPVSQEVLQEMAAKNPVATCVAHHSNTHGRTPPAMASKYTTHYTLPRYGKYTPLVTVSTHHLLW